MAHLTAGRRLQGGTLAAPKYNGGRSRPPSAEEAAGEAPAMLLLLSDIDGSAKSGSDLKILQEDAAAVSTAGVVDGLLEGACAAAEGWARRA